MSQAFSLFLDALIPSVLKNIAGKAVQPIQECLPHRLLRYKDYRSAKLLDNYLVRVKAKLLRQAHRLTSSILKNLCSIHDCHLLTWFIS